MAGNTDKRVMQMEFDNKQFELNIKKSQKSVEDFKKAMDFEETSKGMEKFSSALEKLHLTDAFGKMGDNLQKLTDKFTGLGTISEHVLSQIRSHIDSVFARMSNFIDSMTTAQVSAGMDKYEMLNKSVQTIKAATGESEAEVYDVLQRLNDYTDQTSYNFSDMASNIGKFTSVGIDLRSAERQMEGIANWAARSGAGINEASRAMYNLSQAMGVGKLTKIDWKSIENASMATKEFKEQLIDSALVAGTLVEEVGKDGKSVYKTAKSLGKQVEVNFQNVGDTLSKGWATKDVLSATLEKYYYGDLYYKNEEATGAILKLNEEQQKSFDEMMKSNGELDASEFKTLNNMGVMTDDVKQGILDLAVTNKKLTKEVDKDGKTIYKTVDKTGKAVEFTMDTMEKSLSSGWFNKKLGEMATSTSNLARESYEAAQKCLTFTDVLNAWKDQISTGWMKSFSIIFGDLSTSMEFFSNVCNKVGESLDSLISLRNDILQGWSDKGGRTSIIDAILGDYGKDVATGAYGLLDVFDSVGKVIYDGLIDFFMIFYGNPVDRSIAKKDKNFARAFLVDSMGQMLTSISSGITNFFQKIKEFFDAPIETGDGIKTRLQIVQEIVQGISGALALGYMILSEAAGFIKEIGVQLEPALNIVSTFLGDLGISIYNTADIAKKSESIKNFFHELAEIMKPLTDSINTLVGSIVGLLRTILGMEDGAGDFSGTMHTIGEAIKAVADVVVKVVSPIINFISKIVDAIGGFFKNGFNVDSIKQFGKDLGDAFGGMMNEFADNLPDSAGFLKDWIHNLFGGSKAEVDSEANNLFGLIGNITKKADKAKQDANASAGSDGGGGGLLGLLTGTNVAVWVGVAGLVAVTLLINKAKKTVGKIGDFFGSLGSALKDGFKIKYEQDDSASRFLKIAKGLALIAAAIVVLGLIPLNALIQGGAAMVVIMGAMFGLMFLLKKTQKSLSVSEQLALTAQIMAIAASATMLGVAVGIIALALLPFKNMTWEEYGRAMAGLGGILLQLVGFMALIKVLNLKKVKMSGIAGFAIGLGLLIKSIMPFKSMNWDEYALMMAGLGGVLLELIAAMKLMSLLKVKTSMLSGFAGFALSLGILIFAIKPFADMDWDQYAHAMAGLGGVLGALIIAMLLMKGVTGTNKSMKLTGFILFATSIAILMMAIRPFADMDWDQYGHMMAGLGGVLGALVIAMLLMKGVTGTNKSMKLTGFILFATSIAILLAAVQPFANMNWDQYGHMMAGLGGVLGALVIAMLLMKGVTGTNKSMKLTGFILFAYSIKMLIDAIKPFADLNWNQYALMMAGLGGILLELWAFMGLMKLIGSNSVQTAGLAALAGGLSILVGSLKPFMEMENWEQYAKAMAGLGGILVIMLGFMALMKAVKPNTKNMLQMAIFAGIFAAVVGIFAVALNLVKDMKWETIAAFSVGLAVLVGVFGGIAVLIGKIPGGPMAVVKGMTALAAGIAILIGVLAVMIPLLITNVASGLSEASGHLTLVADMIELFSSKMSGVNESDLNRSIDMVEGFKLLIESFAGFGIYENGIQAFRSQLFGIATVIESFDTHTKNLTALENNKGLGFIKELAAMGPQLKTIEGMDLERLRSNIGGLGGAMMLYARGAEEAALESGSLTNEGQTKTNVAAAVKLMQDISTALAEAGGFTLPGNMPDDKALGTFGTSLAALAGALVMFEEAGGKLGENTENALRTIEFFRDLKLQLEGKGEGGDGTTFSENVEAVKEQFTDAEGNMIKPDQLTLLGADIEELGSALREFAEKTSLANEETGDIEPLNFKPAVDTLKDFVSMQEQLNKLGGFGGLVNSFLFGDKIKLNDLSADIILLGSSLNDFALAVSGKQMPAGVEVPEGYKGIEEDSVQTAMDVLDRMVKMMETMKTKLPKVNGLFTSLKTLVVGKDFTFTDMKTQLVALAEGLGEFGTKLNTGAWDNSIGAENALKTLDSLMVLMIHVQDFFNEANELTKNNTVANPNAGLTAFSALSAFINAFTNGAEIVEPGPGDAQYSYHFPVIDKIVAFMKQIDMAMLEWNETEDEMNNMMTRMEIFRTFVEGISTLAAVNSSTIGDDWSYIGSRLTEQLAGGITTGIENVTGAMQSLMTEAYTKGQAPDDVSWPGLGMSIADGLAKGMKSDYSMTVLTIAASSMIIAAFNAACTKASVNSPSLLFAGLGEYLGAGLANGMVDSENGVAKSAEGMTGVAIDKAKDMIGLISTVMSEDVNSEPTITPVLDMSNVEAGLDGFFGRDRNGNYTIGLDTSIGALVAGSLAQNGEGAFDFNQLKPDYTGLYAKMDALSQQVNSLGQAIGKIKIVLNTGVVAGSVSDDVDRNIGRKTFYAGRNN